MLLQLGRELVLADADLVKALAVVLYQYLIAAAVVQVAVDLHYHTLLLICIRRWYLALVVWSWIWLIWIHIFIITCIRFFLIPSWVNMLKHEVEILWFSFLGTSSWVASCPSLLLGS